MRAQQVMTTQEAVQRGNNLLAIAIAALSGLAFFPEFFFEDEASHRLDEVGLLLVGLVAIAWYLTGTHKLRRSMVPLALLGADLVLKIVGLVLELGDKEDLTDEFGALILFVLATIVVAWLYISGRSAEQSSGS